MIYRANTRSWLNLGASVPNISPGDEPPIVNARSNTGRANAILGEEEVNGEDGLISKAGLARIDAPSAFLALLIFLPRGNTGTFCFRLDSALRSSATSSSRFEIGVARHFEQPINHCSNLARIASLNFIFGPGANLWTKPVEIHETPRDSKAVFRQVR